MKLDERGRAGAAINAFRYFDPQGEGGVLLVDVAERVAGIDDKFLRRYNLITKGLGFLGIKRAEKDMGYAYLPKMYPVVAYLERRGVITSEWEKRAEGSEEVPRRRLYRYLGFQPTAEVVQFPQDI